MGHVFGVNPAYSGILYHVDCSNKDADKKALRLFRLPKYHKLRLTWFKKLRLVDPPNTDIVRVCSEHFFTEECFIADMQAAMGFKKTKKKKPDERCRANCIVFQKVSCPKKAF